MEGFFGGGVWEEGRLPLSLIPQCGVCKLHTKCLSPKMPVDGKGRKKILIVGEAPGKEEDKSGIPFCGESGKFLSHALSRLGIDLRKDCWITNAARCRPPGNKLPVKSIDYCRPYLIEAVEQLQPVVIIPLGSAAVKSLLSWAWKDDVGAISRWVGWKIPCQSINTWICPNWHPSHMIRNRDSRDFEVYERFFERWLKTAVAITDRPFKKVPDYQSQVRLVRPKDVPDLMASLIKKGSPVAFDYETDRLKPDSVGASLVCASVGNEEGGWAFPFHGKAIDAFKQFLRSDVPKIGYNLKFEARWTKRVLGCSIRNWVWDGMIAAHILDNRKDICSLKFQSFALLGQPSYEYHLAPYMKSDGSNTPNRVKSIDLDKLMVYCGLDSYLEYLVAMKQSRKLGITLQEAL